MANNIPERKQAPRSYQHAFKIYLICFYTLMTFLAIIGGIICLAFFFKYREMKLVYGFIGCIFAWVLFVVLRMIETSELKCKLCHGTFLHSKSCKKHRDAVKYPLLSHRQTAMLQSLFAGKFTCMFCGTPYRIGKKQ